MKRIPLLLLLVAVLVFTSACSGTTDKITAVTREDGSGTRSAFSSVFGIEKDGCDNITQYAEVTNSTAVMITSVAGYKNAIGYVSVGSMSDTVKAVSIDGIEPTVSNIKSGSYKAVRNFNIVTRGNVSALTEDFIRYIMSDEGQGIAEGLGYIAAVEGEEYKSAGLSGTITVAGSTSVSPVIESIAEKYTEINKNVSVEVQQTGSSAGIQSVSEGICDIGMSSRELSENELHVGLESAVIATDGIAVIVNIHNPVDDLSSSDINRIFSGEIKRWSELD